MAFEYDTDDEVMAEINMTPLVDVMLVLLIIFMITVPVIQHAVPLQLPQASSQPEIRPPDAVQLELDAHGALRWNQQPISATEVTMRLQQAAQQQPQPALHLSADKQTAYDHVARLISQAHQAGVRQLAFVTTPAKANAGPGPMPPPPAAAR